MGARTTTAPSRCARAAPVRQGLPERTTSAPMTCRRSAAVLQRFVCVCVCFSGFIEKLVTYESPDKGKTVFQCISTVNKRTGQVTRQRELIKENDDD